MMFLRVTCLFLMLLTAGCGKGSTSSSQPSGTVVEIHFVLAEPDFVHLRVVDEQNDILKVLLDTPTVAGTHVIPWHGDTQSGQLRLGQEFGVMIGTDLSGLRQTGLFHLRADGRLVAGEGDTPVDSDIIFMGTL